MEYKERMQWPSQQQQHSTSEVRRLQSFRSPDLALRQKDKKIKLPNRHNDMEEKGRREERMQWPYQQLQPSTSEVRLLQNFSQQNFKMCQKDKKIKLLNRHNDMEEEGDKEKMPRPCHQVQRSTSEAFAKF